MLSTFLDPVVAKTSYKKCLIFCLSSPLFGLLVLYQFLEPEKRTGDGSVRATRKLGLGNEVLCDLAGSELATCVNLGKVAISISHFSCCISSGIS